MLSKPIAVPKPIARLTDRVKYKRDREEQARVWRSAIWSRDGGRCVVCKRVVKRTTGLDPLRGECHHVLTRGAHPDKKFDVNNGVLTCLSCHLRLTRREIFWPPKRNP